MKTPKSWEKARNICIVKTLAKLGHFPTRTTEKEAWFLSPLRSETQASFNVSLNKNLWYDFGMGNGGSVIDLIMKMKGYSFFEAVQYILEDAEYLSFSNSTKSLFKENKIKITSIESIQHLALIGYLSSRKIPIKIANTYCKQVWYRYGHKEYFALGLKNHLGGWELRNKYYKNSSSPKSFSFIDISSKRLLVTEGMFDFLSLVVLKNELIKSSNCIILNSLAFIEEMKNSISNYKEVMLFLDNDHSGVKATDELLSLYDNITDCSDFYTGFIDLNAKLKDKNVREI